MERLCLKLHRRLRLRADASDDEDRPLQLFPSLHHRRPRHDLGHRVRGDLEGDAATAPAERPLAQDPADRPGYRGGVSPVHQPSPQAHAVVPCGHRPGHPSFDHGRHRIVDERREAWPSFLGHRVHGVRDRPGVCRLEERHRPDARGFLDARRRFLRRDRVRHGCLSFKDLGGIEHDLLGLERALAREPPLVGFRGPARTFFHERLPDERGGLPLSGDHEPIPGIRPVVHGLENGRRRSRLASPVAPNLHHALGLRPFPVGNDYNGRLAGGRHDRASDLRRQKSALGFF